MYIINKYFHLTPLIQREPNIAKSKRSRRLTYFGVCFFHEESVILLHLLYIQSFYQSRFIQFPDMVVTDENPFYYAAIGGIILGIATSLNYCFRGKVTGMSGMVYGIAFWHKEDIPEKISIVGGMLVAAGIFFDIFKYETVNNFTPFGPEQNITKGTSYIGYGLAGLLVGFGTKLGNGCTSGHGLCGVSRLSKRSFVAVFCFLTTALIISTIRYHVTLSIFTDESLNPQLSYEHLASANVILVIGVILPFIGGYIASTIQDKRMNKCEIFVDQLLTFLTGLIFGIGLLVAGMVRRSNILGFLGLGTDWNPSMLFVLGCGVLVNLITFNFMLRYKKYSYLGHNLFNPAGGNIDWKLVVGASCFGLGWGIGGLCPGPAIMQFVIFTVPIHVIWFSCLIVGMFIARRLEHYLTEKEKEEKVATQKMEIESKHHHPHMHSIHHKHHTMYGHGHEHSPVHQGAHSFNQSPQHSPRSPDISSPFKPIEPHHHHFQLEPLKIPHNSVEAPPIGAKVQQQSSQLHPAKSSQKIVLLQRQFSPQEQSSSNLIQNTEKIVPQSLKNNERMQVEIQMKVKSAKVVPTNHHTHPNGSSKAKQEEQDQHEQLPTVTFDKFKQTNMSSY